MKRTLAILFVGLPLLWAGLYFGLRPSPSGAYAFFESASGHHGDYRIFEKLSGSGQVMMHVGVNPDATTEQLQSWSMELLRDYSEPGKRFEAVFYDGPEDADHVIGAYDNGTLYDTR